MRLDQEAGIRHSTEISNVRQMYYIRFAFRIVLAVSCFLLYLFRPAALEVLNGWNFFRRFSLLHFVWGIWMFNMIAQLLPGSDSLLMGSKKQHVRYFRPAVGKLNQTLFRNFIQQGRIVRIKVAAAWIVLAGIIASLKFAAIIDNGELLLITAFFYVSDLICVLFWCPFQTLIMKNRCCTTCLIFNWDDIMIFTPAVFIGGFFAVSLVAMSLLILLVWEVRAYRYPERFCEYTNSSIACSNCTDKICHRHD